MRHLKLVVRAAFLAAILSSASSVLAAGQPAPSAPSVPVAGSSTAQKPAPPAQNASASGEARTAESLARLGELRKVLGQYPPSVVRVLELDPVLLTNAAYLEAYPALAQFLDAHPEVRRHPSFYFPPRREAPVDARGPSGNTIALLIPVAFFATMVAIAWLLYQRSRASIKARQETTAKLIDGLLAREDLVSHLDTPAGRRIIDSFNQQPEPAPTARIIRSVRFGIVLVFAGISFIIMQGMFSPGLSSQLVAFGTLAGMVGLGFLVSAGASYLLSRRLGLIQTPDTRD